MSVFECQNGCEIGSEDECFEDVYGEILCRRCLFQCEAYLIDGVIRKNVKTARKAVKEGKDIKGIPNLEKYESEQNEIPEEVMDHTEEEQMNQEKAELLARSMDPENEEMKEQMDATNMSEPGISPEDLPEIDPVEEMKVEQTEDPEKEAFYEENGNVPGPEEEMALPEEADVFSDVQIEGEIEEKEKIKEEVRERSEPQEEQGMSEGEGEVVEVEGPLTLEEIKEITKAFEEERSLKTPPLLEAVVQDGVITDITGQIKEIRDLEEGSATILVQDIDDGEHEIKVTGKKLNWMLFYLSYPSTYADGMRWFWDEITEEEREEQIQAVCELDRNLLFRTELNEEGEVVLYTVKSLKWNKIKVEEILPLVEKVLPDCDLKVTPSTGKHGGKLQLGLCEIDNGIADMSIVVDGKALDGFHSMSIVGHGMILACKNQMLMETSKIVKDIPKFSFGSRAVHAGSFENFVEKLIEVKTEVEAFNSWIEKAKTISLTSEEIDKILAFYVSHKGFSNKVKAILYDYIGNEEVEQVPGTLWGLSMIITYVGTHQEKLRKGVRESLARVGGELLIMAEYWDKFMPMVEERWQELEEERKRKEEEERREAEEEKANEEQEEKVEENPGE